MAAFQGHPRHQYVIAGESWARGGGLLHYNHCVLHMTVAKVHSRSRLSCRPSMAPLYWPRQLLFHLQEWDAIHLGFIHRWGLPLVTHTNPVLRIAVRRQKSRRQVHHAFWAPDLLFLTGLVSQSFPLHSEFVRFVQVFPDRAAELINFPDHLSYVFPEPNPVKQLCEGAERPLETLRLC